MLYNRDYGKLVFSRLEYAPKNAQINGTWYIPATGEQLISIGYYEIVDTPYPTDGKNYQGTWEVQGTQLVRVWTEIPDPPDTRTPAEKREHEYETRLCVVFPENSNELITIDNGVKLVYEYSCETTEVASEIVNYLKEQITTQKALIREEFPDVDSPTEPEEILNI